MSGYSPPSPSGQDPRSQFYDEYESTLEMITAYGKDNQSFFVVQAKIRELIKKWESLPKTSRETETSCLQNVIRKYELAQKARLQIKKDDSVLTRICKVFNRNFSLFGSPISGKKALIMGVKIPEIKKIENLNALIEKVKKLPNTIDGLIDDMGRKIETARKWKVSCKLDITDLGEKLEKAKQISRKIKENIPKAIEEIINFGTDSDRPILKELDQLNLEIRDVSLVDNVKKEKNLYAQIEEATQLAVTIESTSEKIAKFKTSLNAFERKINKLSEKIEVGNGLDLPPSTLELVESLKGRARAQKEHLNGLLSKMKSELGAIEKTIQEAKEVESSQQSPDRLMGSLQSLLDKRNNLERDIFQLENEINKTLGNLTDKIGMVLDRSKSISSVILKKETTKARDLLKGEIEDVLFDLNRVLYLKGEELTELEFFIADRLENIENIVQFLNLGRKETEVNQVKEHYLTLVEEDSVYFEDERLKNEEKILSARKEAQEILIKIAMQANINLELFYEIDQPSFDKVSNALKGILQLLPEVEAESDIKGNSIRTKRDQLNHHFSELNEFMDQESDSAVSDSLDQIIKDIASHQRRCLAENAEAQLVGDLRLESRNKIRRQVQIFLDLLRVKS